MSRPVCRERRTEGWSASCSEDAVCTWPLPQTGVATTSSGRDAVLSLASTV